MTSGPATSYGTTVRCSGVVDWTGGGTGPAGLDIGWCRLDLYLLYDERMADVFLASYEDATGTAFDSWLWDQWALARSFSIVESWDGNYAPLGRNDLTATELRRRHSQWTTLRTASPVDRGTERDRTRVLRGHASP